MRSLLCRGWAAALVIVAALSASIGAGPRTGPVGRSAPPSFLLITIDTLRPDALGWVAARNATPNMDVLAREGFRFPAAVSPVPLTLPAHVSILTGLFPRAHGVHVNGQIVPEGIPTLAEILRSRGYRTAGFVSGYPLKRLTGIERGFEVFDDELPVARREGLERSADDTTKAVLAWLARAKAPWFLWVHYYDPHDPYVPPARFQRPGIRGNYDGEVAYVDEAMGRLLAALKKSAPPNLLTIFVGDHGESFEEHGERVHGFFVYEATVRVPLVVRFPGVVRPGESRSAARLADVAPTALDYLGARPPGSIDGVSLRPTLEGKRQEIPPCPVESRLPWVAYGWAPLEGVRTEGWKLISAPRPELYDLSKDPDELHNVVRENRPKTIEMLKLFEATRRGPERKDAGSADPETLAKLRSLGYLGGGSSSPREPARDLPDPKDHIADRNALSEAETLLQNGDASGALRAFDAILVRDPNNRFALSRSGAALVALGNVRGGIARLEKVVTLSPDDPQAHFDLAALLDRAGEPRRAIAEWEESVRLVPRAAGAWFQMGVTLARLGEKDRALRALHRAAEIDHGNAAIRSELDRLEKPR